MRSNKFIAGLLKEGVPQYFGTPVNIFNLGVLDVIHLSFTPRIRESILIYLIGFYSGKVVAYFTVIKRLESSVYEC